MRRVSIFSIIAFCLAAPYALFGQSCNLRSLRGSYAGMVTGHNLSNIPVAYQAIAEFDGAGNVSLSRFTYVENGAVLVSNGSASGGKYTVNPDCSGSLQITSNGQTFQFALLIAGPDLSQFKMLETDGSATTAGDAVRQEESRGPK